MFLHMASIINCSPNVRTFPRFLAAVMVALLGGCAATTAPLQVPVPPVPAFWPSPATSSNLGHPASLGTEQTHWRQFFPDPRLQALIATALENNRDLRIAAARVEEARALYGVAKADQMPTLNALGSANATGNRIPGAAGRRFDVTLSGASFEIDFWGRLAGLSEAARVSYLATMEAQRVVHVSLVAEIASAYFNLLQWDELTTLAQSTLTLREQSLALIGKGRDLGGTYDYEVQQAQSLQEAARASLAALTHQKAVTTNQLTFLVGSTLPDLPYGWTLNAQGLEADVAPGLPAEVLLLRPDVMAAEQRLAAAHANIGAARAAFLPKVVLTAGLGLASQGLSSLFSGGAWLFQPLMSMPIFDGGRLSASLDVAQARKVMAVAEYEKTLQQAFREVADQLSARASWATQLKAAQLGQQAQAQRLTIAQARYQGGMTSYLDVLEGTRELISAQQTFAQVRRAQLDAAAQLYKALGGGAQEEPPVTTALAK